MERQDQDLSIIPAKALLQEGAILKRITEAVDRALGGDGSITTTVNNGTTEQVIDLPDRTMTITINETSEGTRKRVETTLKDTTVEAPYVTNAMNKPIEERGKGRILLPTEWSTPIRTILYNPTKKQLQAIVSSNTITAPKGWYRVNLPSDKTGNNVRLNIGPLLRSVLGKFKEPQRQEVTAVDLLAHGTYFTIVVTGAPDIDPAVLKQIRVRKTQP